MRGAKCMVSMWNSMWNMWNSMCQVHGEHVDGSARPLVRAKREDWCTQTTHGFPASVASSLTRLHISAKITPSLAQPQVLLSSFVLGSKNLPSRRTSHCYAQVSPWHWLARTFLGQFGRSQKYDLHTSCSLAVQVRVLDGLSQAVCNLRRGTSSIDLFKITLTRRISNLRRRNLAYSWSIVDQVFHSLKNLQSEASFWSVDAQAFENRGQNTQFEASCSQLRHSCCHSCHSCSQLRSVPGQSMENIAQEFGNLNQNINLCPAGETLAMVFVLSCYRRQFDFFLVILALFYIDRLFSNYCSSRVDKPALLIIWLLFSFASDTNCHTKTRLKIRPKMR